MQGCTKILNHFRLLAFILLNTFSSELTFESCLVYYNEVIFIIEGKRHIFEYLGTKEQLRLEILLSDFLFLQIVQNFIFGIKMLKLFSYLRIIIALKTAFMAFLNNMQNVSINARSLFRVPIFMESVTSSIRAHDYSSLFISQTVS